MSLHRFTYGRPALVKEAFGGTDMANISCIDLLGSG